MCTSTDYGKDTYISSIARGNVFACQYHPEKSAERGLQVIGNFLSFCFDKNPTHAIAEPPVRAQAPRVAGAAGGERDGEKAYRDGRTALSKRIIACLDVRCNDAGDLVVTKGDQYDVREEEEKTDAVGQRADAGGVGDGFANKGKVRNLGKPVELASRYYREGADEVTFLNITSFREGPITDAPMFGVLQEASKEVFVPLTIGGGIRDYTDPLSGQTWTALDVASMYFRAGADKVSIGSDAVYAAERYYTHGGACEGASAIEQISQVYGAQAVVVSVDPKRVYVQSPEDTEHFTINVEDYAYDCDEQGVPRDMHGPKGEKFCWYQCTVRGGREGRDMDAHQLAKAVQALGAGELLVNSIDNDGCKAGFDIGLIDSISKQVSIPVIASSGAGRVQHFSNLFQHTDVQAGLAAGIFHRREVPISRVKAHLEESDIQIRK